MWRSAGTFRVDPPSGKWTALLFSCSRIDTSAATDADAGAEGTDSTMRIARETWLFFGICTLDMVSTAWLLLDGRAHEANPIMRFYVELGVPAFVAIKLLLYLAPLYLLEVLRRYKPGFVLGVLRAGIAGYLLVYGIGVLRVNTSVGADAQTSTVVSSSR